MADVLFQYLLNIGTTFTVMPTQAFRMVLLFSLAVCTSSQKIAATLSSISYTTGDTYGGDGGAYSALALGVYWNGTEYSCSKNTNGLNTQYECTGFTPFTYSVTSPTGYYIHMDWSDRNDAPPLQITEFTLTDATGTTYTIQNFCYPHHMQCALDTAEGIAPGSMPSCSQWGSKDSYDNIRLGPATKFTSLYVDIPIFGARFANKVVEGGVRPPILRYAGFTTGTATTGAGKTVPLSVQWDTGLYTCDEIVPGLTNTQYTCRLSKPIHCPATSDFWLSIYSDWNTGNFLFVKEISFVDELGKTYSFDSTNGNFC
eukprot:86372_1